jgi:hypothetical protein
VNVAAQKARAEGSLGRSEAVLRIDWQPGTDVLRGTCYCGAVGEAQDPVRMWEWLLAHHRHAAGLDP